MAALSFAILIAQVALMVFSSLPIVTSSLVSRDSCAPLPIYIPIRNVTLSGLASRRGAAVSVGTPAEPLAFTLSGFVYPLYSSRPSTASLMLSRDLNNTILQDVATSSCAHVGNNSTEPECATNYGGLFDEGSSSTWRATNISDLGTATESNANQDDDHWGSDTLSAVSVNTTLSLPEFPLGIARGDQNPMNTLGLGSNSTLLSHLFSNGAISSTIFGIFQGWTGEQSQYQTDGGLTLGGYDAAKITGENVTLPMIQQDNCASGLMISVTDINMNLRNGSNHSILGPSQGSSVKVCIEPQYSVMTLSEDTWWHFTNVTGVREVGRSTTTLSFFGMLIPSDGAYDGDLTISIYPGLDITIPNHQLVIPEVEITSTGTEVISNSSEAVVVIDSLYSADQNDIPRFGMPFLSSAYLMVDHDHNQFTLWKSQQSEDTNLITTGKPRCSDETPSTTAQPSGKSISSGAIAGAVVGGIAAIGLCIGAYFILKRRRSRRPKSKLEPGFPGYPTENETTQYSIFNDLPAYAKSELPSDTRPPQEMPLVRDSAYDTSPYELPDRERHEMSVNNG